MKSTRIKFHAPSDIKSLLKGATKVTATPRAHVIREALRIGVPEYIRRLRPESAAAISGK